MDKIDEFKNRSGKVEKLAMLSIWYEKSTIDQKTLIEKIEKIKGVTSVGVL